MRDFNLRQLGWINATWVFLGLIGLPEVSIAGTGNQLSPWMSRAPRVDGQLFNAEWLEATPIDLGVGVQIWLGNDARTLYLGVVDTNDATLGSDDALLLYFDDEGGTPPQLDDNAWTVPDCQNSSTLGEGSLVFRDDQSIAFQERTQNGACTPILTLAPRAGFVVAVAPDGLTYEVAIPLDGPMPLRAAGGQRFGFSLRLLRNGTYVACFPADCNNPPLSAWRNLVLASVGCNTGPQDFGSGDPQIGLPLDWSSEVVGSGQGWQQSLPPFYGDPVFCDGNDTGGTGAAACVANFFYSSPDTYSRLHMPLSLAGQTSATVRARALFVMDPNGQGGEDYLSIYLARLVGPGDELLFWNGQSQGGTVTLPLSLAGSPPVELLFNHSTDFAGGQEGGFAQIDDVELLCGPILFADGFESGLTTHWSATVP